jgi:glycine/D-amino acid oxidase-like deaminating enzyme
VIGRYEEFPHTLFLLGYGGDGTVYSVTLSKIIRDLIIQGAHPDANLISDQRPFLSRWSRPLPATIPGVPPTPPGLTTSAPEWV